MRDTIALWMGWEGDGNGKRETGNGKLETEGRIRSDRVREPARRVPARWRAIRSHQVGFAFARRSLRLAVAAVRARPHQARHRTEDRSNRSAHSGVSAER